MNPDDLLPSVTAIVKYDVFPYYVVAKGKLLNNGGVRAEGLGIFSAESVIRIFPDDQYNTLNRQRESLKNDYRKKERQLRIDILEQAGVDFVTVN
ncbi:hypothetical protein [Enterobacter phage vB_ExiM_F5M1E]|nr:hypothetical protein [Enterobacter phage vB_ExiM_F1M1E]UNA02975.1 hypothetical protein [Enterobacter phage vB_ExiM_F2M1E]UNA03296.1 hypothetical protein [Enterobacter phage vB_ExiM_F4M1E]UNA03616.1 hypothetical protein [Enterobacter phage vB_ExiM_F5M1E]UNA03937.1 hypothetical protein [Pantoea phage vB_PdiM_F5M2A]